ncbi:MAG: carboxypeptidase regulatory-like domain-containing protein [Bryobacteraceae bacterium]|nr:carboxypeptidase regulatory-like domain-containing protein [Bryobacteraceae bacterium]MDW8378752.1 carboxypeptidase regulatory-like domain-containing protein [Bryobacterales bacterium]
MKSRLLSTLLLSSLFAFVEAQVNTSTLAGVVTDESGSVVPNAKVTATLENMGLQREAVSNESGEYVLPQLPPGRYKVTVQASGFQTAVAGDVVLAIAERAILNISLKVGAVTEQVTVSAAATPLLERETASLGQVITRRAINDLPLNGRNYITLGSLSPGVIPQIPASTGPASFISATTQRSDRSLLVGGNRESSTSYLYDGVEMRNPRIGDSSVTPSLDAVQEFKIQRNFFQAEFGNSPGIINVASRGGSNEFHGSIFWFLRNNVMDARNFFARQVEPFKRNQFGAVLGGPVKRDKVFFFGNFEGFRQRLGVVQRGIFPTQTQLRGDFTGFPIIHDPLTFNAATNTRLPFAGNRIPENRINRISRNFFPYIPVVDSPVVNGANLEGTPVQRLDDTQYNVRGDWIINSKHSLFGRYTWQNAPLSPAALAPLAGRQVDSKGISAVAQLTSSLSPAVVNVFRAAYAYMNLFGKQVTVDRDLAAEIGITGVSTTRLNWGVPVVNWQGYSGIGSDGLTQGNILHNYQLSNATTWVKSSHTVKFGYEIRQSRFLLDSDNGPRGNFTFNASYSAALDPVTGNPVPRTGDGVADFLLGYPTNMSGAVGTSLTHFQFHMHNLFLQDDWKITRELTLNYGLRWEFVGPAEAIKQERGNVYGFDFRTGRQLFPILGQIRNSIVEPDYKNFAPRLGLAYNPKWMPTVAIRAGAGIYFDQTQMNEVQFTTNGPPAYTQQNRNATGRGLPEFEFGRNTLPVVVIPPVDANYVTPRGTNLFATELDGRKPRVYMWTFSIQKSFGANWVAEAAYVGSQGRRLSKRYNAYANATPGVLYEVTPGVATYYPQLTGMLYSSQAGMSQFHGLNLKLDRRLHNGVQLLMAYSWMKSIDTDSAGSWGTPNLNPANFQLDKGPSDFNIPHRWVTSVIYELPFGTGKPFLNGLGKTGKLVVDGWQVNAIASWQSGVPRIISAPNNTTLAFVSQRADATGVGMYSPFGNITPRKDFGGANTRRFWINPAAFAPPAPLRFGTSGRNILSGPAWWNFDLSAFKNFNLGENKVLQFRAEAFNGLNNVQFNPPDQNVVSPNFGTLQSAQRPRVMQLALRLTF